MAQQEQLARLRYGHIGTPGCVCHAGAPQPELGDQLDAVAARLTARGHAVEVIFVDDGSRDRTAEILKQMSAGRPYITVIRFARNFGQTAAMSAGFDAAAHDVVIPLDADLQNDPADIPRLLDKLEDGYDVVSGWRRHRKDTFVTRKIPSWAANKLISRWSGVALHDYGCTLKAYRKSVMSNVHLYGEMHRFIPIYAAQQGARVAELEVNHRPRVHGTTKYGLGRVPNVFLDLLLVQFLWRYGTKPMHVFGKFGLANVFLSFVSFAVMVWFKFWGGKDFVSTPLPALAIMFFLIGCLSILMGLLAEVVMRTYYESSSSRTYLVRETYRDGDVVRPGAVALPAKRAS
ncbi:MAG: glycosyltransferase family 2 protein [Deltaproteobacteria bacterium]|nr:MAG: glycosyltransferase family 2 protein [Deltaproteobacteria bacterium]